MQKTLSSWFSTTVTALVLVAIGAFSSPGYAQVKPGDFITPENAAKVRDLVGPGVYYKVEHGMTMKIVPTQRVDWPPPYKDATEKYSAQVRLSDDNRSIIGFVAGQPFPLIDPNDPDVAIKIIWNNVFRPITSDDYDLRFYDCDSEYEKKGAQTGQIEYFQIGHYAGYDLVGRTEVEPLPTDPDFKTTGRYWLFGLYPILSPQEIRGTGFIRWRYADPKRGDDIWSLNSGSRRIRRVNESIMSSSTHQRNLGARMGSRSLLGLQSQDRAVHLQIPGREEHARDDPRRAFAGIAMPHRRRHQRMPRGVGDAPYVHRRGAARSLAHQRARFAHRHLHGQRNVVRAVHRHLRSVAASLFRAHIYWLATRDRPVPDAKVAIYPFKRSFVVGAVSTDVQSGLATMCYLPGMETPERECWYINMGAVDRNFFTTDAMFRAAAF